MHASPPSVVSLDVCRRHRQAGNPATVPPDELRVLELMIDTYFTALRMQIDLVKQEKRRN